MQPVTSRNETGLLSPPDNCGMVIESISVGRWAKGCLAGIREAQEVPINMANEVMFSILAHDIQAHISRFRLKANTFTDFRM